VTNLDASGQSAERRRNDGTQSACPARMPERTVQTAAFETEDDVIRPFYVVRNPDKLRHLATASTRHERGAGMRSVTRWAS
jgi:hypothetical protein